MFVRLLVCVGFLTLLCFGLVGCGDEDPVSVSEVAKLVQTVPASGERAAAHQPVALYFDKTPLAVTVNGTAARVARNGAIWSFPKPPSYGDRLFHIEWTNPDGSPNVGTSIRLTVMAEVAKLVKTIPASGEDASEYRPVVLHFDKEPRAVTVNGTAARVEGKRAVWCFPNPTELGDQLFHIEWTNPDGSLNVGEFIRLAVYTHGFSEPSITLASVSEGDADVDPDPLYIDGIWFEFDESVIDLKSKLLTEDGEDLGWEVVSDDRTLIFRLGANGELLENGRRYTIQIVVAEPWIYGEFACECMDCSWYKDTEIAIGFVTIDK